MISKAPSYITDHEQNTALHIVTPRYKPHTALLPAFFGERAHAVLAIIENPQNPHGLPAHPLDATHTETVFTLADETHTQCRLTPVALLYPPTHPESSYLHPSLYLHIAPHSDRSHPFYHPEKSAYATPGPLADHLFTLPANTVTVTADYHGYPLTTFVTPHLISTHTPPHLSLSPICSLLTPDSIAALDTSSVHGQHAFDIQPSPLANLPYSPHWYTPGD